ncbi:MAG TPA: 23S rRNA (guanosine(2251)-2'-O)-methyltransferase RlmB [Solirubrobacteraceae bacterium]|nr:23S rRNA (guanosine(2251)-2'-O)-methyltransferase RlmB [Solirubrobacteraceae bacterium]
MILYGRNPVHEALRAGRRPVGPVWATERAAREPWLRGVRDVQVVSADELQRRCGSPDHQGICAEAGGYPYVGAAELLAVEQPFVVALDELQDPQNLGAICRTAECAGATGVVICERRAATVTPAVAKASAGAVEHLRIARVRNLADFLADAKAAGCWCYGADGSSSTLYDEPDYAGGVVLVLGSEESGLRTRVAQSCDVLVALPQRGRVQSLNANAAAAALVYGILQRRPQA